MADDGWADVFARVNGGGPGLEVLCGMIGSGKTTYARQRAADGAVVVCHDDIVKTFTPGKSYDPVLAEMCHAIEDAAVAAAVKAGRRVVIDRTNTRERSRFRWLGMAKDLGVPAALVVFPMENHAVHAKRRFDHDPQGLTLDVWLKVAGGHARELLSEPPPKPGDLSDGWQAVVASDHGGDPLKPFFDRLRAKGVRSW